MRMEMDILRPSSSIDSFPSEHLNLDVAVVVTVNFSVIVGIAAC